MTSAEADPAQQARRLTSPARLLVLALFLMAPASFAAKVYHCGPGGKIVQDVPCAVVNPPLPALRKPPCDLTAAQRTRAMHLEEQFLSRYADEAAHLRQQRADLQPVLSQIRAATRRLAELTAERKKMEQEIEFYPPGRLPAQLQAKLDASEAAFAALRDIFKGHEQSISVIRARYECERATYGKLWSGAPPGSSGCDRPACAAG